MERESRLQECMNGRDALENVFFFLEIQTQRDLHLADDGTNITFMTTGGILLTLTKGVSLSTILGISPKDD